MQKDHSILQKQTDRVVVCTEAVLLLRVPNDHHSSLEKKYGKTNCNVSCRFLSDRLGQQERFRLINGYIHACLNTRKGDQPRPQQQ